MIRGRLNPAIAVIVVAAYSAGGLVVALVTRGVSHLACPTGPRVRPGVLINLPLLVCHQEVSWGSLFVGLFAGLAIGLALVGAINLRTRVGQPH